MLRYPVSSSELQSIGDDEVSEILEAEFVTGALEHYLGVSKAVFTALMAAPSHGEYVHTQIEGRYVTRRVW